MTFKVGVSGNPAGRPKKQFKRVDEELSSIGKSPIHELMLLMPDLEPYAQAKIWLELMSYCHAKPKFIELTEEDLQRQKIKSLSNEELIAAAKEALPKLEKAS